MFTRFSGPSARFCIVGAVVLLFAPASWAKLKLPAVFSDHMVLQSDIDVPVWGWADPGEEVTVQVGLNKVTATADPKGKWQVKLPRQKASATPVRLTVSGRNGERLQREDVLAGEVWIGSGQSNMAMTVSQSAQAERYIQEADQPQMRLFLVPHAIRAQPQDDVEGHWVVCSPKTVGAFSAVLYQFGRNLHEKLKVPVGLIHSSWGGTSIQCWMPKEAFADEHEIAAERDRLERDSWLRVAGVVKSRPAGSPPPQLPQVATLHNGMIAPLIPYGIRGVTWYQGENNIYWNDVAHYAERMEAMVRRWRKSWDQGDWAFLYVQIAPYGRYHTQLGSRTGLPEMWQEQLRALKLIPNSGQAPIIDLGEVDDIHPKNKHDVGNRLATIALAKTYHVPNLVYEGPVYASHRIDGRKVYVKFTGVGGGLISRDNQDLTWFEIAGQDHRFVPAKAQIEGSAVIVWSDEIDQPSAVRFAWDEAAMPNLANREGLPATAFQTP